MAKLSHYFRTPKKRTLNGKKYLVLGYRGNVNKRAIAQFFTKYGWKDVKNDSILAKLYEATK